LGKNPVRLLTYSCVSDERLSVGHDGIDGDLFEVLRRDDGDRRVEAALGNDVIKLFGLYLYVLAE
jgi:hypothetical protein